MPEIGEVRRGRDIGKVRLGRYAFVWAACEVCGKERWVAARHEQPINKICIACAQKARGLRVRRENNPHWNGGRNFNHGYVRVIDPRVEETTYILEHHLVWEQEHNCPVPKGYVVHHLNGVKTDNRPCNLVAIAKPQHESYTFIHALQKRIRELESKQGS